MKRKTSTRTSHHPSDDIQRVLTKPTPARLAFPPHPALTTDAKFDLPAPRRFLANFPPHQASRVPQVSLSADSNSLYRILLSPRPRTHERGHPLRTFDSSDVCSQITSLLASHDLLTSSPAPVSRRMNACMCLLLYLYLTAIPAHSCLFRRCDLILHLIPPPLLSSDRFRIISRDNRRRMKELARASFSSPRSSVPVACVIGLMTQVSPSGLVF